MITLLKRLLNNDITIKISDISLIKVVVKK